MCSPTLQTLQDSILLLRWVAFKGDGFQTLEVSGLAGVCTPPSRRQLHLLAGDGRGRGAKPLEELARIAASRVRDAVGHDNTEPVFAVTHSMGAVVLRHMQLLPTDERPRWCVPLVESLVLCGAVGSGA
jgi:pimeloyl-ACP methyl ester carboxylesterase